MSRKKSSSAVEVLQILEVDDAGSTFLLDSESEDEVLIHPSSVAKDDQDKDYSLPSASDSPSVKKNTVFCLICNKPQQNISSHLRRVCMQGNTPEEAKAAASRAIASQKHFARDGRVWHFSELQTYCTDVTACANLCSHLQSRGLIILNNPQDFSAVQSTRRQEQDVLELAKPDIQHIHHKLMGSDTVPHTAATTFRHYCLAILMLRHQLTGSAVMAFCVNDWLERKSVAYGVRVQFGPTSQKSITLTAEEEGFLECYLNKVRPLSLKRQGQGSDDKGRFFLGESGVPLCNPALDLQRLRTKYLQPKSEGTGAASASDPPTGQASTSMSMQEWDAFCKAFPVSLNDNAPSRDKCVQAGFPRYRPYYRKWRQHQLQQRASYILSRSLSRTSGRPHKARIQVALDKTSWTTNRPLVEDVLRAWVPSERRLMDTKSIITSIMSQKWKGLAVKNFGMPKGKGVVAVMPFNKDEVICDYHASVTSEAEGKREGQSGFLFFIKGKETKALCIEAKASPCTCHPSLVIYGRMISHSGEKPNVKPHLQKIDFPDGPQEAVLFIAKRDIVPGEELLCDYSVTMAVIHQDPPRTRTRSADRSGLTPESVLSTCQHNN